MDSPPSGNLEFPNHGPRDLAWGGAVSWRRLLCLSAWQKRADKDHSPFQDTRVICAGSSLVSGLTTSPRPCVPMPSPWSVSSRVRIFQKTEPLKAVRFPGSLSKWCSPAWEARLTRLMKIGLMGSPCKYKVLTAPQRLCTLKMKGNHPVNGSVLFPRWTELFVMFGTE